MSCLFDSVVALLAQEGQQQEERPPGPPAVPPGAAAALRQRCADVIGSDAIEVHGAKLSDWQRWDSDTNESLEEYAARMRSPTQWGGGLELVALAHVLGVEIAVHLVTPAGAGCVGEFRDPRRPPQVRLNLLYNGSHYTPSHVSRPAPSA